MRNVDLMLITNDDDVARYAVDCGVNRIFVDLEVIGKQARQGHLDSVISFHSIGDARKIRAALPSVELLVRINPVHDGSREELRQVVDAGADLIMLPMFSKLSEVQWVTEQIGSATAKLVPLVETRGALEIFTDVLAIRGIHEVYIGLNDLHLSLGLDFMFEPLADGTIERCAFEAKGKGLRFGFGGLAQLHEGLISGYHVLAEHVRVGSSSVILARSFHGNSRSLAEFSSRVDLRAAISKLRAAEAELRRRSPIEEERDRRFVCEKVTAIKTALRAQRAAV